MRVTEHLLVAASVLAALIASACSSVVGPRLSDFVVLAEGGEVDSIAALVVVPESGVLEVTASMRTPCSSYTATGVVSTVADTVTLVAIGRVAGQCPFDVVGNLIYRATIRGLAPGDYRLIVRREWSDANWAPEIAVDRFVRVY